MGHIDGGKKRSKREERRYGKRYGLAFKLRCVKLRLKKGLPLPLFSKEAGSYGSTTTMMDLRLSTSPVGCPEIGMVSAAAARLAQYYHIPSWVAGGWGDSKLPDAQAAHEKTLTVDVIHEIGPFGDFISHEHTRKHMKSIQSQPKLIDRRRCDFWLQLGGKDLDERTRGEAKYILRSHKPDPLSSEALSALSSIVGATEEELCIPRGRRRRKKS